MKVTDHFTEAEIFHEPQSGPSSERDVRQYGKQDELGVSEYQGLKKRPLDHPDAEERRKNRFRGRDHRAAPPLFGLEAQETLGKRGHDEENENGVTFVGDLEGGRRSEKEQERHADYAENDRHPRNMEELPPLHDRPRGVSRNQNEEQVHDPRFPTDGEKTQGDDGRSEETECGDANHLAKESQNHGNERQDEEQNDDLARYPVSQHVGDE